MDFSSFLRAFHSKESPFMFWSGLQVRVKEGREKNLGAEGEMGSCTPVGWGLVARIVIGRAWIACPRLGAKCKSKEVFSPCSCSEVVVDINCRFYPQIPYLSINVT